MASRIVAIALVAVSVAAIASAATFDARSEHYALTIATGERTRVVVTELDTGSALLSEEVAWPGVQPAEFVRDIGNVHLTLRLSRNMQYLTANLDIEQGEMLVDSIHTGWILAPRRAHVHAEGALRVGGNVKVPHLIDKVEPLYTEEARRNRVSGVAIVEMLIDTTGHVADAVIIKPLPFGLSQAAIDAVKQWKFEPPTLDGKPVAVIFDVTVNFKLDAAPPPPIRY